MKNRLGAALFIIAAIALFVSCVPQKKFLAMQDRANRLNRDSNNFYNQILGLNGSLSKLQLEQEMTQSKLQKSKEQLSNSNETIAAQQARLAELQQRIEQQKLASESLRKKIADAMGSFNSEQLTVSLKNGKVYVSMSEQLLFASGSAEVGAEGNTALASLAKALNENSDINVNVEGHTDSIPIARRFADNCAEHTSILTCAFLDINNLQVLEIIKHFFLHGMLIVLHTKERQILKEFSTIIVIILHVQPFNTHNNDC
jgi:chemotaxis protein MotB